MSKSHSTGYAILYWITRVQIVVLSVEKKEVKALLS